jgi:microcystin synthetase protein McyJ
MNRLDFDKVYASAANNNAGGWINLGYLAEPEATAGKGHGQAHDNPFAALARKLAVSAALTEEDIVVDVGCGLGAQDVLFAREFGVRDITAFNIAPAQIHYAKRALEQLPAPLREVIRFKVGDATCLPQPDQSATKVLSLESAFHYDTREDFFAEAYRILSPGGKLAIADILPKQGVAFRPSWLSRLLIRNQFGYSLDQLILPANRYDIEEYTRKLELIGFRDIVAEDISHRIRRWPRADAKFSMRQRMTLSLFKLMSYYIVTATK